MRIELTYPKFVCPEVSLVNGFCWKGQAIVPAWFSHLSNCFYRCIVFWDNERVTLKITSRLLIRRLNIFHRRGAGEVSRELRRSTVQCFERDSFSTLRRATMTVKYCYICTYLLHVVDSRVLEMETGWANRSTYRSYLRNNLEGLVGTRAVGLPSLKRASQSH